MTSDGQKEENIISTNLTSESSSTFGSTGPLEDFELENNCSNVSNSSVDDYPSQVESEMGFQAPTSVDGAFQAKLGLGLHSRTSSGSSSRPHQVDAVHPFFNGYRTVKFDRATSTDNQVFYCRQCNIVIDLDQEAVNLHFLTFQHTPIEENCVYCNTAVYEYFYNDNVYYFHRCPSESESIIKGNAQTLSHRPSSNESKVDQELAESVQVKLTENTCCGPF